MTIKREEYRTFYQNLVSLAEKKGFPARAMFELTYKCNFHCLHCYVVPDPSKEELGVRQIRQILDQLRDIGCSHIGFTGGEPLLRKDIFEILQYAKKIGFIISLLTNGYLINKRAAEHIASLRPNLERVDISVLGATERTFESITGKRNGLKKIVKAITLLKDHGVNVQVKSTLLEQNKDELLMIKKMAKKLGAMFKYSPMVDPRTDGSRDPLRYQVEFEDIYAIQKTLSAGGQAIHERPCERRRLRDMGKKRIFLCGLGRSEVSVSPYGELNLCYKIHHPQYDILKGSLKDGWHSIKQFVKKLELSSPKSYLCRNCAVASACYRCPAISWSLRGDLTSCVPQFKRMARANAKHFLDVRS